MQTLNFFRENCRSFSGPEAFNSCKTNCLSSKGTRGGARLEEQRRRAASPRTFTNKKLFMTSWNFVHPTGATFFPLYLRGGELKHFISTKTCHRLSKLCWNGRRKSAANTKFLIPEAEARFIGYAYLFCLKSVSQNETRLTSHPYASVTKYFTHYIKFTFLFPSNAIILISIRLREINSLRQYFEANST